MSRLNRECMYCNQFIDTIVHSCFIPLEKNDRLEVTGHEECLKVVIKKWDGRKRGVEQTKSLLGLEVE